MKIDLTTSTLLKFKVGAAAAAAAVAMTQFAFADAQRLRALQESGNVIQINRGVPTTAGPKSVSEEQK